MTGAVKEKLESLVWWHQDLYNVAPRVEAVRAYTNLHSFEDGADVSATPKDVWVSTFFEGDHPDNVDVVYLDEEPYPLTLSGARHTLLETGDVTWGMLPSSQIIHEACKRIQRKLSPPPAGEEDVFVTWGSGIITNHPRNAQDVLDDGFDVFTGVSTHGSEYFTMCATIPLSVLGGPIDTMPILFHTSDYRFRVLVVSETIVNTVFEHLERFSSVKEHYKVRITGWEDDTPRIEIAGLEDSSKFPMRLNAMGWGLK